MNWTAVIGQERAKQTLYSAIRTQRLPHALLFHGPQGVGKDAMAIELARALHCERSIENPCRICDSCLRMHSLQHPELHLVFALPVGTNEDGSDGPLAKLPDSDVATVREQIRLKAENPYHQISIPRATTIKITSIREIRREAVLSKTGGRPGIFLIFNAEQMGDAASNALLKTLEEPSKNTLIILTTSRRDALLPTIRSRCQEIRFEPLHEEEIRNALIDRQTVEPNNAAIVARLSNGSYGRALQLLGEDLNETRQEVLSFIRLALGNNRIAMTQAIEKIAARRDRDNVVRFLNFMLIWFRDALVLPLGGRIISLDQQNDLSSFRARFPDANLTQIIADLERAISLVHRNVYIMLILLHLSVQFRNNILHATEPVEPP